MTHPLRTDALTWTGLLGQWMQFARASLALPRDAEGDRWRESVPSVIALQAVTFALAEVSRLDAADRPHARDKAEVLINEHTAAIERIWHGQDTPETLAELIGDARLALRRSLEAGVTELCWCGDEPTLMPPVEPDLDAGGTLAVMMPGTIVMPGEPVAWWADRSGEDLAAALPGCRPRAIQKPRQVYRQTDEKGRFTRDVIAPVERGVLPGLPLLVPLLSEGKRIGHFTLDADHWQKLQRAAMPGERIPVVEQTADEPRGGTALRG